MKVYGNTKYNYIIFFMVTLSLVTIVIGGILVYKNHNVGDQQIEVDHDNDEENNLELNDTVSALDYPEAFTKLNLGKLDFNVESVDDVPESYFSEIFGYSSGHLFDWDNNLIYKCENQYYGKCGFAMVYGTFGFYNLEEFILTSSKRFDLNNRYYAIYDGVSYLSSYDRFNNDTPLFIFDRLTGNILGMYKAIVYNGISDETNYVVVVDFDDKMGMISLKDGNANSVIDCKYDYVGYLGFNKAMIVDNEQFYIYDLKTLDMIGPFNNQIASYSDYFIVTNEGKYSDDTENNYRLYSIDGGKLIVNDGNFYIELFDEYAIVVDNYHNLNIFDKSGNKVLRSPIENVNINDNYSYNLRCCTGILAYRYNLNGDVLELEIMTEEEKYYIYYVNLKTGEVTN